MTENEAIKELKAQIETAESMISYNKDFEPKHDNLVLENKIKTAEMAISALKEIQQYRAIGTVEEFREVVERQKPKIPNIYGDGYDNEGNMIYDCPNCGKNKDHKGRRMYKPSNQRLAALYKAVQSGFQCALYECEKCGRERD